MSLPDVYVGDAATELDFRTLDDCERSLKIFGERVRDAVIADAYEEAEGLRKQVRELEKLRLLEPVVMLSEHSLEQTAELDTLEARVKELDAECDRLHEKSITAVKRMDDAERESWSRKGLVVDLVRLTDFTRDGVFAIIERHDKQVELAKELEAKSALLDRLLAPVEWTEDETNSHGKLEKCDMRIFPSGQVEGWWAWQCIRGMDGCDGQIGESPNRDICKAEAETCVLGLLAEELRREAGL